MSRSSKFGAFLSWTHRQSDGSPAPAPSLSAAAPSLPIAADVSDHRERPRDLTRAISDGIRADASPSVVAGLAVNLGNSLCIVPRHSMAIGEVASALASSPHPPSLKEFSGGEKYTLYTIELALRAPFSAGKLGDRLKAMDECIMYVGQSRPAFFAALDAIGGLHPALPGVINLFKWAIDLEFKRRENNKKVRAIYIAMMYTMQVFLKIKPNVNRPEEQGDPVQDCLSGIEYGIKQTVVECEMYHKEWVVMKVLRADAWTTRLKALLHNFKNWRKQLHDVLIIEIYHSTRRGGTSLPEPTPDDFLDEEWVEENDLLDSLDSSEVQSLTRAVAKRKLNSPAVATAAGLPSKSESYDEEAADALFAAQASSGMIGGRRFNSRKEFRQAVRTEFENALTKSHELIERKFQDMRLQQGEDVNKIIRVIDSGGHSRIADKDMKKVWKTMKWKATSVPASHFVTAVRDYYAHLHHPASEPPSDPQDASSTHSSSTVEVDRVPLTATSTQDELAIPYIITSPIRPIIDAIDEDASGWIGFWEVNAFTAAGTTIGRPAAWSVAMWLAYWAVGFPSTCRVYAPKISAIRAAMIALAHDVLPSNRRAVDRYLEWDSLRSVDYLARGPLANVDILNSPSQIPSLFYDYAKGEKKRLLEGLKKFRWNVDRASTIALITEGGRIERYILPLLYITLRRHLAIIQRACTAPINYWELWDAIDPINVLVSEAQGRCTDLASSFRNHNREPKTELKLTCSGTFAVLFDDNAEKDNFEYEGDEYIEDDSDSDAEEWLEKDLLMYSDEEEFPDDDVAPIIHSKWYCDACGDGLRGSRIRCIDCSGGDSVDLCGDKASCLEGTVFREEDGIVHLPHHDLLKTYRYLHFRDRSRILSLARRRVIGGRRFFDPAPVLDTADEQEHASSRAHSTCLACGQPIREVTCWMCIECSGHSYICNKCDSKQLDLIAAIDKAKMAKAKRTFESKLEAKGEAPAPSTVPSVIEARAPAAQSRLSMEALRPAPLADITEGDVSQTRAGSEVSLPHSPADKDAQSLAAKDDDSKSSGSRTGSDSDDAVEEQDPDTLQAKFYSGHWHRWWHVLVRVSAQKEVDVSIEARLASMEAQLVELRRELNERKTS